MTSKCDKASTLDNTQSTWQPQNIAFMWSWTMLQAKWSNSTPCIVNCIFKSASIFICLHLQWNLPQSVSSLASSLGIISVLWRLTHISFALSTRLSTLLMMGSQLLDAITTCQVTVASSAPVFIALCRVLAIVFTWECRCLLMDVLVVAGRHSDFLGFGGFSVPTFNFWVWVLFLCFSLYSTIEPSLSSID